MQRFPLLFVTLLSAHALLYAAETTVPEAVKPALAQISENSLKGHLTFLASDLLEGRDTPSRGQDIAAEYIAAQFRRIGLEPVAQGTYFQSAAFSQSEVNLTNFRLQIKSGENVTDIPATQVTLQPSPAVDLTDAAVLKVLSQTAAEALKLDDVRGKVVLAPFTSSEKDRRAAGRLMMTLQRLQPAALLLLDTSAEAASTPVSVRMPVLHEAASSTLARPFAIVRNPALGALLAAEVPATVTLHLEAAKETPVTLRNVAGVLRGSDPTLKESYLLVTAHYDHVGLADKGDDRIYNGANDDGSGTVSVIEIADALAHLPQHPKRSILFMTYFGEEKGLLGSRYFGRHPLVPLSQIVGDLNLEQVGRTDAPEGSQEGIIHVTGRTFSNVTDALAAAGKSTGVRVEDNDPNSDAFFARSDNQALADQGIPAHTVCVAYEYPDYHKVSDSADKINYANMVRTDRTVALAIWTMSEDPVPPHWNEANAKTSKYVAAYQKLHPTAPDAKSRGQE